MQPIDPCAKLLLFRACFSGLRHLYGTHDFQTGQSRQIKAPVTDSVLLAHLQGTQPYRVYLLTGTQTQAIVADFDHDDAWPPLAFVRQARHYGIPAYLERSKRKGWHAWIFFRAEGPSDVG